MPSSPRRRGGGAPGGKPDGAVAAMSARAATRIAISGYGRIGRCVLRALYEHGHRDALQVVAINETAAAATAAAMAQLTRYDSVHGHFASRVEVDGIDRLRIAGDAVRLCRETRAEQLPWAALGVELVLDCSGGPAQRDTLSGHLAAGARRLLVSQPGSSELPTIVLSVNGAALAAAGDIVSCASCTTHAVAPVIDVIDRALGVERGLITTLHAAMNDQPVLDAYCDAQDLRKNRASASLLPVRTGLAQGLGRVLPRLAGRFAATAMRLPVLHVSAMELALQLAGATDAEAANQLLAAAARGELAGSLDYSEEPLASIDFCHRIHSGIVDAAQTQVAGDRLLKLLLWFDSEWSYANRMLELARAMAVAAPA